MHATTATLTRRRHPVLIKTSPPSAPVPGPGGLPGTRTFSDRNHPGTCETASHPSSMRQGHRARHCGNPQAGDLPRR